MFWGCRFSFFFSIFRYFSLEAGEGRTGSESNPWLVIINYGRIPLIHPTPEAWGLRACWRRASRWTHFKTITSHCSVPFWVEPSESAKIISKRKCMFPQQLQTSCRLSAGCKGWGTGPIWQRARIWRGAPYLVHAKLHPALVQWAPKCFKAAQAVGSPDVQEERSSADVQGFALVFGQKAGQLSLVIEEFLVLFCFINLAFLFKFRWGDVFPLFLLLNSSPFYYWLHDWFV